MSYIKVVLFSALISSIPSLHAQDSKNENYYFPRDNNGIPLTEFLDPYINDYDLNTPYRILEGSSWYQGIEPRTDRPCYVAVAVQYPKINNRKFVYFYAIGKFSNETIEFRAHNYYPNRPSVTVAPPTNVSILKIRSGEYPSLMPHLFEMYGDGRYSTISFGVREKDSSKYSGIAERIKTCQIRVK